MLNQSSIFLVFTCCRFSRFGPFMFPLFACFRWGEGAVDVLLYNATTVCSVSTVVVLLSRLDKSSELK